MFWVFTDNSDATLSLNDFALFTNWFYRRSNLHYLSLLSQKSPFVIVAPNELFGKNFFCVFKSFFLLINIGRSWCIFLRGLARATGSNLVSLNSKKPR